jgi:anti-sigma-K factor RskA
MRLSHPDRRERLDRLAAEFALGTSPRRVRQRLSRIARSDRIVADALTDWERRLAVLAATAPGVTPPPRVWARIAARLGLDTRPAPAPPAPLPWWGRLAVWRGFAALGFVAAIVLGIAQFARPPLPSAVAPLVVVLAGSDAKPALIATASRNDRFLTVKAVGNVSAEAGRVFELWALPQGGAPKSLGVLPAGPIARIPLTAPVNESLANVPALAISLEPPGGSPTGQPTGPVLYSGSIERMY